MAPLGGMQTCIACPLPGTGQIPKAGTKRVVSTSVLLFLFSFIEVTLHTMKFTNCKCAVLVTSSLTQARRGALPLSQKASSCPFGVGLHWALHLLSVELLFVGFHVS